MAQITVAALNQNSIFLSSLIMPGISPPISHPNMPLAFSWNSCETVVVVVVVVVAAVVAVVVFIDHF